MEAGTDIQHVISFDRPAHPSTFWRGHLRGWGYYEMSTHSPQLSLSLSVSLLSLPPSLSFFFSLSHLHPLTSPALSLQLGQVFIVSHPVVFHRHWDRPEPAWSKEAQGMSILHSCPHMIHTHTHITHQTAAIFAKTSQEYTNVPFTRGFELVALTVAAAGLQMRLRSYHRWECSPCALMTPLGSGRIRNSKV